MFPLRRTRKLLPLLWFAFGFVSHYIIGRIISAEFNITPPEAALLTEGENQFLVVLVLSSVNNIEQRQAIRDTWASDLDEEVRVYFVISAGGALTADQSREITKESSDFKDLLILHGVDDSFQTLTLKVLVALLWVTGESSVLGTTSNATLHRPFESFSFVLKCDDDTYVQLPKLMIELRNKYQYGDKLYWGFFDGRAKVKKAGKYKELGWNICDTYLPYALGGGYVLGRDPVMFITRNAKYWKRYQSEDTSVGAWLSSLKDVHREHDPRFDTEYLSRGCHQSYLVTHKHTVEAMRKIHHHLISQGNLCPKEYRTRLSYRYDWNVIPSKCCARNNPAIP